MAGLKSSRGLWHTVVGRLMMACILVFALQVFMDWRHPRWMEFTFGLSLEGLTHGWLWQLITFQFLHGSLLHLFMNMTGIYFLGRPLLKIAGERFLVGLWVAGGLAGGLAQLLWDLGGHDAIILGASAAGFAYLMVFAVLFPRIQVNALFVPFPVQVKHFAMGTVIASIGFLLFGVMPEVGHVAHLGGALMGFAAGRWLKPRLALLLRRDDGYWFQPPER